MTKSAISSDISTTDTTVLYVKNNIIYGVSGPIQENSNIAAIQINTQMVDPQFTDPTNFDFTLQSSSPAIDNGDESFLLNIDNVDYYGNPRNNLDIGAIEFQTPVSITEFDDWSSNLFVYPNPTYDILNVVCKIPLDSIEIYSVIGELIKHIDLENGCYQLDLSDLTDGIYILQTKSQSIKFIKRSK